MIEFAVVSGKGGTGKTSLTAAFISLAGNVTIADADVDAPDLHILLKPHVLQKTEFLGMKRAYIDLDKCTYCDICRVNCRFDAIDENFVVDPTACEGCTLCYHLCPVQAIEMRDTVAGYWYVSETRYGKMVHGMLEVGEENSGKLVTIIRKQALFLAQTGGTDYLIIDGPPGTGCPVNSTLSGLKYGIIVTEPTQSGLFDMKRILDLMDHFGVKPFVIINKYDLNPEKTTEIEKFLEEKGISYLGRIPFDPVMTEAQLKGLSVIEMGDNPISREIKRIWETFRKSTG
ncbi:MAG: ATP-binding protein [Candidatus Hydrothermae bacterium]|nr:ATP-binding protein [Candidatus Hydrothermae bacterium]